MNFENLKDSIDRSANEQEFIAGDFLKLLGFDPALAIRMSMRREIVCQFLIAVALLGCYWMPIWKSELARSLYLISMSATTFMTLGYIFKLTHFLATTKPVDYTVHTRELLVEFVHRIKLTIAGYESFVMAGCFLLPLPTFAIIAESADVFEKWIYLRLNLLEICLLTGGYLSFVTLVIVTTKTWTNRLYGDRIRQLEELIRQLAVEVQPESANDL